MKLFRRTSIVLLSAFFCRAAFCVEPDCGPQDQNHFEALAEQIKKAELLAERLTDTEKEDHPVLGAPMLVDNPDTPGTDNWELSVASQVQPQNRKLQVTSPSAELDYGIGERGAVFIDLPTSNANHAQVGAKYRFRDQSEDHAAFSASLTPRFAWNLYSAPSGKGNYQNAIVLPLQLSKDIGKFTLGAEMGASLSRTAPTQWSLGTGVGYQVDPRTQVMGEVHMQKNSNGSDSIVVLNFGSRYLITPQWVIQMSVGHTIVSPNDQSGALVYFGMQYLKD